VFRFGAVPELDYPSRMLLPRGAVRLRCDLGEFLKRHRQGKLEGGAFGTQAQVAARVGITRQTLSDIERGTAWPGPATLDALLDVLELGWEHIAHAVETDADARNFVNDMPGGGRLARVPAEEVPRRHRNFLEGDTGNQIIALGKRIRTARERQGMTLAEVARRAGISAALLSRMERGQIWRSRVFAFVPATQSGDPPKLIICNPWIARLCNGNGGEGD
jgi:transcriptional regulator with XRE-family HTH domain